MPKCKKKEKLSQKSNLDKQQRINNIKHLGTNIFRYYSKGECDYREQSKIEIVR